MMKAPIIALFVLNTLKQKSVHLRIALIAMLALNYQKENLQKKS